MTFDEKTGITVGPALFTLRGWLGLCSRQRSTHEGKSSTFVTSATRPCHDYGMIKNSELVKKPEQPPLLSWLSAEKAYLVHRNYRSGFPQTWEYQANLAGQVHHLCESCQRIDTHIAVQLHDRSPATNHTNGRWNTFTIWNRTSQTLCAIGRGRTSFE